MDKIINQFQQRLLQQKHRAIVLLVGDRNWYETIIQHWFLNQKPLTLPVYVFGENELPGKNIDIKSFRHYLGLESAAFIYTDNEINPDVLAALSGTICRGGVLFLCCTSLPNSQFLNNNTSVFLQRFYRELLSAKTVLPIYQTASIESNKSELNDTLEEYKYSNVSNQVLSDVAEPLMYDAVSHDQSQAVNAILKVALGHRNRPLVITADRGRGKTTSLALACLALSKNTERQFKVIITSPKKEAVDIFFTFIKSKVSCCEVEKNSVSFENITIAFCPLDIVLAKKPKTDLLLIDEAAAFPLYLIKQLFSSYHRTVFSSTLHGYEGAGRGFALKFSGILNELGLSSHAIHLTQAIRWGEDDPLEQFIFNACLLNAQLPELHGELNHYLIKPEQLTYKTYSAQDLLNNEILLANIYAILVTAHYQTTPNDLVLLLDNEQLEIRVLEHKKGRLVNIIGVAMIMQEGGVDQATQTLVKKGKRRIKNHFLPQSILTHCGDNSSFDFSYWRIMRIAVHPKLQGKGLGQLFIKKIEQEARSQAVDILGTSFALNITLLNFWQKQQWQLLRVGFTKDKASGEHSGLLVKSLSTKSNDFVSRNVISFYRAFPFLLSEQFKALPRLLTFHILEQAPSCTWQKTSALDIQACDDFIHGYRQFDPCAYHLHIALLSKLQLGNIADKGITEEVCILIARLLQKQSISEICTEFKLSGKKELNTYIQKAVDKLID